MELKIVNPNSFMAHLALGISEQRSDELCDLMTAHIKKHGMISFHESLQHIASICNSIEELAWCSFTHGCYCTKIEASQFPNLHKRN